MSPQALSPYCHDLITKKRWFLDRPPLEERDLLDGSGACWLRGLVTELVGGRAKMRIADGTRNYFWKEMESVSLCESPRVPHKFSADAVAMLPRLEGLTAAARELSEDGCHRWGDLE